MKVESRCRNRRETRYLRSVELLEILLNCNIIVRLKIFHWFYLSLIYLFLHERILIEIAFRSNDMRENEEENENNSSNSYCSSFDYMIEEKYVTKLISLMKNVVFLRKSSENFFFLRFFYTTF